MSSRIAVVTVTAPEIRKMFNEGGYATKVASGELSEKLVRGIPAPPSQVSPTAPAVKS
jgi:hypothetical protein